MESQKDAIDIWEYIETHHDQEKNRFGNANAIALDNGMTYIYKTLPNGRLLSIDDWFEGYVDLWGTYESGLLYAVKFEKTQVGLYEYTKGLASEPAVTLKYSKKKIDELKELNRICPPIRVKYDYVFDGNRFWYIEIFDEKFIVFNLTKNTIEQKLKVKNQELLFDSTIVYRFPFAPYRYAIVTDTFINDLNWVCKLKIIDFINNKSYDILDANYKNYTIGVLDYNQYVVYAYKTRRPVAHIRYNQETSTLDIESLCTPYVNHREYPNKFKLGDLLVTLHWEKESSFKLYCKDRRLSYLDEIVINQDYLNDTVEKSFTIKHLVSRTDGKNILLSKAFTDFLEKGLSQNKEVSLPGNTEIDDFYYSTDEKDLKKIKCLLNYVYSEIHTKRFIIGSPYISFDVKIHKLDHGKIVQRDVVTGYKYDYFAHESVKILSIIDYYEQCNYDISITVHIKYFFVPPQKYVIVTDEEEMSDSESISLDTLFDMPEETDVETSEKETINYYKYFLRIEE